MVGLKRKPRNKPIFVKATQDEHKAFTQLAISRNTTLSELIRQMLHAEIAKQNPKSEAA